MFTAVIIMGYHSCLHNTRYPIVKCKIPLLSFLYTRYPIVARALGLAAARARAKVSCIQLSFMQDTFASEHYHQSALIGHDRIENNYNRILYIVFYAHTSI